MQESPTTYLSSVSSTLADNCTAIEFQASKITPNQDQEFQGPQRILFMRI